MTSAGARVLMVALFVSGIGAAMWVARLFSETLPGAMAVVAAVAFAVGAGLSRKGFLDVAAVAAVALLALARRPEALPGVLVLAGGLASMAIAYHAARFIVRHQTVDAVEARSAFSFAFPRLAAVVLVAAVVALLVVESPRLLASTVSARWPSTLDADAAAPGVVAAAIVLLFASAVTLARFVSARNPPST